MPLDGPLPIASPSRGSAAIYRNHDESLVRNPLPQKARVEIGHHHPPMRTTVNMDNHRIPLVGIESMRPHDLGIKLPSRFSGNLENLRLRNERRLLRNRRKFSNPLVVRAINGRHGHSMELGCPPY